MFPFQDAHATQVMFEYPPTPLFLENGTVVLFYRRYLLGTSDLFWKK